MLKIRISTKANFALLVHADMLMRETMEMDDILIGRDARHKDDAGTAIGVYDIMKSQQTFFGYSGFLGVHDSSGTVRHIFTGARATSLGSIGLGTNFIGVSPPAMTERSWFLELNSKMAIYESERVSLATELASVPGISGTEFFMIAKDDDADVVALVMTREFLVDEGVVPRITAGGGSDDTIVVWEPSTNTYRSQWHEQYLLDANGKRMTIVRTDIDFDSEPMAGQVSAEGDQDYLAGLMASATAMEKLNALN